VLEKLNAALRQALSNPEFKQALEAQGSQPYTGAMQEYQDFISAEKRKWNTIVKEANIRIP
jgi:tripartite-type tricarboxylate transporter receptor subunit TctC